MSSIDRLIRRMAPHGIVCVALGDVTFEAGERNVAREYSEVRSVTNSQGLVRTSDFFENTRTSSDTRNYKIVRPGMYVYNPSRINVGSIAWLIESRPVIVSPMYVVFGLDTTRVTPEYLHLFLSSRMGKRQIEGKTEVGARFRLTYESLSRIRLPLPPVEVQREIVKLLGPFTALRVELESEIQARRLQFSHYRDRLYSFHASDVQWTPMGEAGHFIRGRRFTKNDVVESGIPSIHYGEIYTHYGVSTTSTISQVRSELSPQLRFANPGDVVIAAVGETVEDVGKAVAWLGEDPAAIHDDTFLFRHEMNPSFVSYFLQTNAYHTQKGKFVSRAKVKRLSGESLAKIVMPVPSLDEQGRIVEILDKFNALVNDNSSGLPAEVVARSQQYDYYRERLLTFEEAVA